MSKLNQNILLISGDYPLIASPTLAKAYGVAAATFLQKLHYCLENNEAKVLDGKNIGFIATSNGNKHSVFIAYQQLNVSCQN